MFITCALVGVLDSRGNFYNGVHGQLAGSVVNFAKLFQPPLLTPSPALVADVPIISLRLVASKKQSFSMLLISLTSSPLCTSSFVNSIPLLQ